MVPVCAWQLSCADAGDGGIRLDARLGSAVAERFAPVTRPTGVAASPPCPERRLADGRPDPACGDAGIDPALRALVPAIRRLDTASDEPAVLRVRALWQLAMAGADDRTVDLFAAALDRDPSAARHNDLAAVLLLRAARADRPADLAAALDHAAHAAALDPGLDEARVNRAFALASLGLRHAADRAWEEIGPDTAEPLADAYRTSPAARAPPAARSQRARGEILLGRWATSLAAGEAAGAEGALAEARVLADGVGTSGDSTLLETIAAIDTGDPERRHALEDGHAAFHHVRGDATYATCDLDTLAAAENDLTAAGTPFVAWVSIDRAICDYFAGDYPAAARRLDDTLARWGTAGRPAVAGRAHALLGLITMLQGRYAEADAHYAEAIARYESLGEAGEALYQRALRARNFTFSGLGREAWAARVPALQGLDEIFDRERATTIVQDAVQAMRHGGQSWAALSAVDEQIFVAEEAAARPGGENDLVAYARIERATLLAELGRPEDAAAELDRAEAAWRQLPSTQEIRDAIAVELAVARASLDGGDVTAVDRALAFHADRAGSGAGNRIFVVGLLRLRAQIAWRRGDLGAAEKDLAEGLAEVERQRGGITDPEQQARFAGHAHGLVTDLVRLLLDERGDPLAALAALDRSEGRLVEAVSGQQKPPLALSSEELAAAVPTKGLVVRWGQLPDRLLVWSIDPLGHVALETRRVTAETVGRLVTSFRDAIRDEAPVAERRRLGSELARLVLPARFHALPGGAPVVFVPTPSLQALPFAALPIEGDQYLVERHLLAFAPNLASLLRPSKPRPAKPRHGAGPPSDLLIVADPAFDQERFHLERLQQAAKAVPAKAVGIIANGGDATVLGGEAATRRAVLAALPHHRVLHAAAHGITDSTFPHRGGILLAADPANPEADLLTAADLEGRDLGQLELVILAACSTALGTVPETAEYAGLAAAFLARGVPAVVTAAWAIDDAAAARFFAIVHRRLASGEDIVAALNAAQIENLHATDRLVAAPRSWAAFRVDRVANKPATANMEDSTHETVDHRSHGDGAYRL